MYERPNEIHYGEPSKSKQGCSGKEGEGKKREGREERKGKDFLRTTCLAAHNEWMSRRSTFKNPRPRFANVSI
jgi:hypothetical protein